MTMKVTADIADIAPSLFYSHLGSGQTKQAVLPSGLVCFGNGGGRSQPGAHGGR